MRFVALVLAVAILGAGLGLASVTPVQAHGGGGGGQVEFAPAVSTCPVIVNVDNAASDAGACDGHNRG